MRLTLRSLLAYLDDSLEAPEAEELGRKIEESEFARALVHRMRSATRRLRLGAPKLSGKGMGLDPNTVAEYLDYTLAADRVQDFEQVCLESDVHLAEVAACHQILTNVLAGVADVDPDLRDRIVRLREVSRQGEEGGAPPSTLTDPPMEESDPAAQFDESDTDVSSLEGTEFGRPSSGIHWPIVATLVVVVVIVGLLIANPFTRGRTQAKRETSSDERPAVTKPSPSEDGVAGKVAHNAARPLAAVDDATGPDQGVTPSDNSDPSSDRPQRSENDGRPAAVAGAPSDRAATDRADDAVGREVAAPAAEGGSAREERAAATDPPDKLAQLAASMPEEKAVDRSEPPPKKLTLPPDRTVAKLTSPRQVLARYDAEEETYFRVPALATLEAGDRLIVPPLARPQLLVLGKAALQLTLPGPVRLELPQEAAADPLRFRLNAGRTLWMRHAEELPTWEVEYGGRVYRLTMKAPATTVAVAAHRATPVGEDPATASSWQAIEIIAVDGPLEVSVDGDEPITVDAGQVYWHLQSGAPVVRDVAEVPDWIRGDISSQLERGAAEELERLLPLGRPVLLSLHELSSHRRVEIRSLAIESLLTAGEFWPLVDALADRKLKAYWSRQLDAVRRVIQEDPQYAQELRNVLQQRRGDEGNVLYRLLWGYTDAQLEEGADRELVSLLESEVLDQRVVAFDTLQRIAGATYLYRPDRTPKTQRSSIHKWRRSAGEGKIRHRGRSAPDWLAPLLPAADASPMPN